MTKEQKRFFAKYGAFLIEHYPSQLTRRRHVGSAEIKKARSEDRKTGLLKNLKVKEIPVAVVGLFGVKEIVGGITKPGNYRVEEGLRYDIYGLPYFARYSKTGIPESRRSSAMSAFIDDRISKARRAERIIFNKKNIRLGLIEQIDFDKNKKYFTALAMAQAVGAMESLTV